MERMKDIYGHEKAKNDYAKRAEDIYGQIEGKDVRIYSKEEIDDIFKQIQEAVGDVALTIALARQEGWFSRDDKLLCEIIRRSSGNIASAVYIAKQGGWWDQDDQTTCETIINAEGSKALVICNARECDWWVFDNVKTSQLILEDTNPALTDLIKHVRAQEWWVEPVR